MRPRPFCLNGRRSSSSRARHRSRPGCSSTAGSGGQRPSRLSTRFRGTKTRTTSLPPAQSALTRRARPTSARPTGTRLSVTSSRCSELRSTRAPRALFPALVAEADLCAFLCARTVRSAAARWTPGSQTSGHARSRLRPSRPTPTACSSRTTCALVCSRLSPDDGRLAPLTAPVFLCMQTLNTCSRRSASPGRTLRSCTRARSTSSAREYHSLPPQSQPHPSQSH